MSALFLLVVAVVLLVALPLAAWVQTHHVAWLDQAARVLDMEFR